MAFFGLLRSRRHERAGFQLYTRAVEAAREPALYGRIGAPDTLDGRFDLIGLHVALLIHRLRREERPGPALAQAVFDAMFSDMDFNLRELGVSDMAVGKRMKAMWEAFHGRAEAYGAALDSGDETALAASLARNVWRVGNPGHGAAGGAAGDAASLARLARAQAAHLGEQGLPALAAGRVEFLPPDAAWA